MKAKTTLLKLLCLLFIIAQCGYVTAQSCTLTFTTTTTQSTCKATGSITVNASNGSGNYNFTVSNGTFSTTTSSNVIGGLQAGAYTVKVKDIVSGCVVQQNNITVAGNYQDPRFQLSATDVTCINGNNGSITAINQQYGKAPFYYTIVAPSASGVGTNNATGIFTNLVAGDYSIQLSDSCGGIQTRVVTIANYNWSITGTPVTKVGCDSADVTISLSDNKGNTNASGIAFNGFLYGVSKAPGDTVWSANRAFRFFKGTARSATFIVKDACGNTKTNTWFDTNHPAVGASVSFSNKQCSDFTATITGQQNLTSPQYCLYNNANVLVTCNTTGIFNNVAYGSYCIAITDNCYDTTINRCFTVTAPVPAVAASVTTSNLVCGGFTATVTGQQNLVNPQYCIFDSANNNIACNTTGIFNNLPYGSYCINITDGCTGTVITRCFTQKRPVPAVGAAVSISNKSCSSFTVTVTGQSNLNNGQYCIYDGNGILIACNSTGVFNNLAYGSYCVNIANDPVCYDTTIVRCFNVTQPVPSVSNSVSVSSKTCTDFTAKISGQTNLTNPQYCLYDNSNNLVTCNTTGQFDNLAYGSYCIKIQNDASCYDTLIQRCFSVTRPVPSVSNTVSISNKACSTFTATITGQTNLTSPQYCLYDNSNNVVACNTTGVFNNITYGSYCIHVVNTCYDTTITRCITVAQVPLGIAITTTASCTIGTTNLKVTLSNGSAPYTINVYNPGGVLVSTTTTNSTVTNINDIPGLPVGTSYKVVVAGGCNALDSALVTPVASWLNRSINANSKCPGGQWLNGSGDLVVNASFSGGTVTPKIIKQDGSTVNINYSTQSGSSFTFINMQPAVYIIQYTLTGCGSLVYDTFNLSQYTYPNLDQSAVYQCNNNNFSVSAAANGGIAPFTYEIIGSYPSTPSINKAPQASATFSISNGVIYSLVRLRVIDACGNATINDASILPLGNTVVTASSNCFYNNISLSVDTIPNATYAWYKKTSPTDSVFLSSNQTHSIGYLLPSDTGTYVSVISVNSGCLTKVSTFHVTGSCGGALLAAEGISFDGTLQGDNVQLKWTTVKAFEADKFIVERSNDGRNFKDIGTVMVTSNNMISSSQYYYSDANAPAGSNFYRLRIVKQGRNNAYTKIIEVKKAGGNVTISVMPNPVADAFSINFQKVVAGNYNICLVGADGKFIINSVYNIHAGEVKTIQRPPGIVPGVYYLLVRNMTTNDKETIKLFFR